MTISQIKQTVSELKPTSLAQLRRYIRAVGIKPIGARQRPQRYPDDAAGKILVHLGFEERSKPTNRIVSMATLRNDRSKPAELAAINGGQHDP